MEAGFLSRRGVPVGVRRRIPRGKEEWLDVLGWQALPRFRREERLVWMAVASSEEAPDLPVQGSPFLLQHAQRGQTFADRKRNVCAVSELERVLCYNRKETRKQKQSGNHSELVERLAEDLPIEGAETPEMRNRPATCDWLSPAFRKKRSTHVASSSSRTHSWPSLKH